MDSSSSSCSHRPAPPPAIMGKLGRDLHRYTGYTLTIQAQEASCGPVTPGLWGCGHRTAP